MSDNDTNDTYQWDDLSPNSTTANTEEAATSWAAVVSSFGEHGDPGFSETIREMEHFSFPGKRDIRWTMYRSDDGELLAIHGSWLDSNGQPHPVYFYVNPAHQRKGIGTMFTNFLRERYMRERGRDQSAEETFKNITVNSAAANFINKYVNNDYTLRNSDIESYNQYVADHIFVQPVQLENDNGQ